MLSGVKILSNHAKIVEIQPEVREEIVVVEETFEEVVEETKEGIVSDVIADMIGKAVPKSSSNS